MFIVDAVITNLLHGLMLRSTTDDLLRTVVFKHLETVNCLSGRPRRFIVDAVVTIPIGILGSFIWPGTQTSFIRTS
ncbi:hypothetical protein POJ06DRAFT_17902 [Lipomyces tetrasporus]|uniref:Uncharacterized protein n=1 Tax=Lipomyces tetrasporus TaxID=54092 RepID=A0AAD7VWR0_9ASCO|nr:uncharacterized protein POJ06DRAFT_17902 [Lipomyces tetrasporus]KAJ8104319.1 hypothetical protein POJ06DRAFT_17902 [Lipomyces tetrasporus]